MLPSLWNEQDLFPVFKLRNGIEQLFEELLRADKTLAPFQGNGALIPPIDIKETDEAITLDAEMPGLKQEEIKVSVEEGVLTISAERKQEEVVDVYPEDMGGDAMSEQTSHG